MRRDRQAREETVCHRPARGAMRAHPQVSKELKAAFRSPYIKYGFHSPCTLPYTCTSTVCISLVRAYKSTLTIVTSTLESVSVVRRGRERMAPVRSRSGGGFRSLQEMTRVSVSGQALTKLRAEGGIKAEAA